MAVARRPSANSMENLTFNEIYATHGKLVFNVCLNYVQNQHDAEEITQDVFVTIHKKLSQFQHKSQLKTWIYRIAINRSLDFLKAQKRLKRSGIHIPLWPTNHQAILIPQSSFNHPGVQLEHKEAIEHIMKHLNQLPINQKTALLLKTMEGLSQKQIADIMKMSSKAVESLLSRGRANLKKRMM